MQGGVHGSIPTRNCSTSNGEVDSLAGRAGFVDAEVDPIARGMVETFR